MAHLFALFPADATNAAAAVAQAAIQAAQAAKQMQKQVGDSTYSMKFTWSGLLSL